METVRLPNGKNIGFISDYGGYWKGYSMYGSTSDDDWRLRRFLSRESAIAAITKEAEEYADHRLATKVPRSWDNRRGGKRGGRRGKGFVSPREEIRGL